MPDFAIVPVPEERLDELEPLWRALYEHHVALSPHLRDRERPFEQAWETRRRSEREWLAREPQSFVIAAENDGSFVGYAFVRIYPSSVFASSWSASDPLAELATLAVLPAWRARGMGSALLDAVEARLRELGIEDMAIGVLTNNADAARLYERRGAVPFLTKFIQRVGGAADDG